MGIIGGAGLGELLNILLQRHLLTTLLEEHVRVREEQEDEKEDAR
ncbi:hypothetical protein PARHAE_03285 [Paracoccus haematequi]|uniref:Uncharacterized protein n=1 Tax=Paracoccus haematequi TaxID=2491866 RepID=A0A447IRF6_9RHOB|nr:hypothetical protein [Paracoccus haematequi]VDS10074.1 hypothetical protein PARHAE_03285 [Paracoccus haematequi]